jgi:DNA-binding NarL/FixJ family response regulator
MKKITVTFVSSRNDTRQHCADLIRQNPDIDLLATPAGLSRQGNCPALSRTDVVVIDESVVRSEGFAAVRRMLDAYPVINSLIIIDNISEETTAWTLMQGVRGVMGQHQIGVFLGKAIRRIDAGEVWVSRSLLEWLRSPARLPIGGRDEGKGMPRTDWSRWH